MASITAVHGSSAARSCSTRTCAALTAPLSLPQVFSTDAWARRADADERAHSTTSPCLAAVAARPQAIAPLPAMPSRSCMRRYATRAFVFDTESKDSLHERSRGPRGRHRRGGPHADRQGPQGEGLLQGHASE